MIRKINVIFLLVYCWGSLAFGQKPGWAYSQPLEGITDQWHRIELPDNLFGHANSNLSDIRIFGLTANGDTIEAPYLLELKNDKVLEKEVAFQLLNTTQKGALYYFTLKVHDQQTINQIHLDFRQNNFDWKLTLQGSQDQKEWFTLLENYRILGIKNDRTDYQFTNLRFPDASYRYFRIQIVANKKPDFEKATILHRQITKGEYRTYEENVKTTVENKDKPFRETIVNIELPMPLPVSFLKIDVDADYDYYRPVTIQCLQDSFKTAKGWQYQYTRLATGILTSVEENRFDFNNKITKSLKAVIRHHNNEPLKIRNIVVGGNVYKLAARFTQPARYHLAYGNPLARKPQYDIGHFADKIPTEAPLLTLGRLQHHASPSKGKSSSIFENKWWLWGIMLAIILLLGWFTVSLMGKR